MRSVVRSILLVLIGLLMGYIAFNSLAPDLRPYLVALLIAGMAFVWVDGRR